jgi:hypothetical protein
MTTEDVEKFLKGTGVDSLAISIGTSHGANKFKPAQCTRNADGVLVPPPLRFDILEEKINQLVDLNGYPLELPLARRQIVYRVRKATTGSHRNGEVVSYYLEQVEL